MAYFATVSHESVSVNTDQPCLHTPAIVHFFLLTSVVADYYGLAATFSTPWSLPWACWLVCDPKNLAVNGSVLW
jgi:hypothetical protein